MSTSNTSESGDAPTTKLEPDTSSPAAVAARSSSVEPLAGPRIEGTPQQLGRYLVIDELGRGGMGVVLRAYDPRLQREVALKVLPPRRQTDEARARMVREARAMAKLSHPNVVAVYDVETDADDRLLVAMEYVPGTTLGRWLDERERPWTEIVDAFLAAGAGLHAAHQQGLLHRDFKLDNVLVGDDQRVRVTDFGLARLAEAAITAHGDDAPSAIRDEEDDSLSADLTAAGTVVGTLRYMAPEQLTGRYLTEAIDQYAFCVALWRGLAGAWPQPQSGEALRRAKRQPPPPWPRGLPGPKRLGDVLRRGLAPDPTLRWPDMRALLAALERARGRRRRMTRAAAIGAAVTVVGLGLGAPLLATDERCTGAREQLAGVWTPERSEQVGAALRSLDDSLGPSTWERLGPKLEAYAEAWVEQHTEACEATTIRGEQSSAALDLRMACLQRGRTELDAVARVLSEADASVLLRAHSIVEGLPPPPRCADVDALRRGVTTPPPALEPDIDAVHAELARARVLLRAGRYDDAVELFEQSLTRAEPLGYEPLTAEALVGLGRALSFTPRSERALEILPRALEASLAIQDWAGARQAATRRTYVLAGLPGRGPEALAFAELARGLVRAHPDPVAEADVHSVVGNTWQRLGRHDRAEAEFRAGLELLQQLDGDPANVSVAHNNLGNALHDQGRYEEAAAEHRESLAIRVDVLGEHHPYVADSRVNLGNALNESELHAKAEAEYRAALIIQEASLDPDHPDACLTRLNLATALNRQGKTDEAEQVIRRAVAGLLATRGEEHMVTAIARFNLAAILRRTGRLAEAEAELRRIIEVQRGVLAEDHPELARFRSELAELLLERDGTSEEVRTLAQAAWAAREHAAVPPQAKGWSAFVLARALASEPSLRARARTVAQQAIEAYDAAGSAEGRRDVEAWLASLDR